MVLSKMKEISEAKLGKEVKKAVGMYVSACYLPNCASRMFSTASQPTSMIHNSWQPKMLGLSLVLTSSVSSTNPPRLPSLTV